MAYPGFGPLTGKARLLLGKDQVRTPQALAPTALAPSRQCRVPIEGITWQLRESATADVDFERHGPSSCTHAADAQTAREG